MRNRQETVQEVCRRWNEGARQLDLDLASPDLEIASALTKATHVGAEGLRQWMAEIDEQFEQWQLELNKTLLLEDGRVLALGLVHVRGRESGVALDQPVSLLFEFQDDRVQRVALFTEHESGRMAAGL